jgi:hypothetical protein
MGRAQTGANSSAGAYTSIVKAISIRQTQSLTFGLVVSDTKGGTVTVGPDGSWTSIGPVLIVQSKPGATVAAAQFIVTGTTDFVYTISLPASAQTLTGSAGGAPTMLVDSFTSNPSGAAVLTHGTSILSVGATLHVPPGPESGIYNGSFTVTVAYQ